MSILYALCGLAFSGKSTVARRLADATGAPIVSLDAINRERGLSGGAAGGMSDVDWEETSRLAVERLAGFMKAGTPVILDDTLSHRFLRDRYRRVAAEGGYAFILVYVDTALAVIEARRQANAQSAAREPIDEAVFRHHRERFEPPAADEIGVRLYSADEVERWVKTLLGN